MQVIGEAKLKQGAKQMNKPLSMACAKKLSEHEAVLTKLKSIVRETV